MRLHTNHHTPDTIRDALAMAELLDEGIFLDECGLRGSRSHARAYEVRLVANAGADRNGKKRRPTNSGQWGSDRSDPAKAATYEEWGYFIAALYADESGMKFGPYADAQDFLTKTRYVFDVPVGLAVYG